MQKQEKKQVVVSCFSAKNACGELLCYPKNSINFVHIKFYRLLIKKYARLWITQFAAR